jgi:DNA-binding CsgD family transcriptional regulator
MSWGFVGRGEELAALETAWLASRDEGGPVVVVHGEPGIGKTRTVAELAGMVRKQHGEALWGTCYERPAALPYEVWAQALGEYVRRAGVARLQARLGADTRWLAPLLPYSPGFPEPASVPAGVGQLRLAEVLVRVLECFDEPPLVVLDDMQWAHPESLELFGHVARLTRRALIVVIMRGTTLDLRHPTVRCMAEVRRQRPVEYLALGRLSRAEGGELLEQVAGRPLDAALAEQLYAESDGSPFFLTELGRHVHRYPGARSRGGQDPPESVRGAIGLRIGRLSDETRHMLQLASVFSASFAFAELQALTEYDETTLLDAVDEALAQELLRPEGAERYGFSHAFFRQTLYEQLSPSRRARLHRQLAEALEKLYSGDPSPAAVELVRQYHASATLPCAERGASYALTAAQAARKASAPAGAVVVLRLGLDLVAAEDIATRARLLSELAVAEAEAGLFSDAPRTLADAIALLEQQDAPGEAIADLVYEVGIAFWLAPSGSFAIEPLVRRALADLGAARSLPWARLMLLRRFAQPETLGPLQVVGWSSLDPDALQIARSVGSEADYARTLDGFTPWFGRELDEVVGHIDGWRNPAARLQALIPTLGYLTFLTFGVHPATSRLCAEFASLADDMGLPYHRALACLFRAAPRAGRGQLTDAAGLIGRARALIQREPAPESIAALVTLIEALTTRHIAADWPRLAQTMWDVARSPEHVSEMFCLACAALAAQACARSGQPDRAREILGYLLPALACSHPLESPETPALGVAAEAIWELRATDLAVRLLPNALRLAAEADREFYLTSTELTVARLSSVSGCFDQAADYFGRARATLERSGQLVLGAITDHDEARARLDHHRPGAPALLVRASARFAALGMGEWSHRAEILAAVGQQPPDGLTAREAEILRLVAQRRTNKEIAAELVLSVHTVERHVQNAYRKIGARSRADAGEYVARTGV